MKVRIAGIGAISNEKCFLSGYKATGYIDIGDGYQTPCKLALLGPGPIGSFVKVPKQYQEIVKNRQQFMFG